MKMFGNKSMRHLKISAEIFFGEYQNLKFAAYMA